MQTLQFDDGVQEFEVNGREILRFNPSDPNVYNRFLEIGEELQKIEREYVEQVERADGAGEQVLVLMRSFDSRTKERLAYAFGPENDFDRILGGVNLMAVATNGERVVTNLFKALTPILEAGVNRHDMDRAAEAVEKARQRRSGQRK